MPFIARENQPGFYLACAFLAIVHGFRGGWYQLSWVFAALLLLCALVSWLVEKGEPRETP